MTEEQKIDENNDTTEELQLVKPTDFKIPNERFFSCPKCESKAIAFNPKFSKTNIVNSLEGNEDKDNIVLICANCNHTDLLISFIQTFESRYYSPISPVRRTPKNPLNPPSYWPQNSKYTCISPTSNQIYARQKTAVPSLSKSLFGKNNQGLLK